MNHPLMHDLSDVWMNHYGSSIFLAGLLVLLVLLSSAELRCAGGQMSHPFQVISSCLRCSDQSHLIQGLSKSYMCEHVWLPRYASMVADVGVFQVADAPTYGYIYSIP